ncbi:Aminopyrimidine aminohydrolase [Paraconexibacter sp. AEG42_29]|uniref:Aminopyrimidine aminohydrolase n=1 Tax=Paraconexibacter sp. AEG42_29 TaxID=2997339 RepID=A0AAU7AY61_9ACTN
MIGRFSDDLRSGSAPIWEAQHAHPFVRGIADGTLPDPVFAHFLAQDYVFLVAYARLLALGTARAPDLATMERFAALTQAILTEEMALHRALCAEVGLDAAALERTVPAPTTQAYTDFLLRTASLGDVAELAAALLPCMWGYAEIGARLADGPRPDSPRYAAWIDTYADPGFQELATWCRGLVDDLGRDAAPAARERMAFAFRTCSRHELAFWEMAWTQETWPV